MTDSITHIEQMQSRLEEMAEREQALIAALDEALSRADRKLLNDVRSVTADHEARRSIIMTELQCLAERIGAFPVAPPRHETIEYSTTPKPISRKSALKSAAAALQSPVPRTNNSAAANDAAEPHAPEPHAQGGDWRKAAQKIAEELDFRLNGKHVEHAAAERA